MNRKQFAVNTLVAMAIAASMPQALAQDEHPQHEGDHPENAPGLVREVRQVTREFQDVNAARAAGYVSTENCVSGPEEGAMGVHYVNETYIADGVLDVQRPEVLVYEPVNGQLRLAAVEFLVIAEQWDAANETPPVVGGQLLNLVDAPNRLRLPAFYELHVWAWKRNSSGTFADWNPRVSCVHFTG